MNHGLSESTVALIQSVFANHHEVQQAILYGSRAKGTFKKGSDIDLTLVGPDLDYRLLLKIMQELDDLLLPYKIDLSVLSQIDHADLREHIARVGQEFYSRNG